MFKQNISHEIWGGEAGKYRLRDHNNIPIENTPEETCQRVSKALSNIEKEELRSYWNDKFNSIMGTKFAGGGRIMANVGADHIKKETSPINCTVMRQIPDSLVGIMDVLKDAAITLKSGCGVGYDFSPIRPSGAHVFGAGSATSGVISFMKIFDASCATIMSGGGRRGAQMGCLDISHPEIESFISAKREDGVLRYFNLSILITDSFMTAVEKNKSWDLWFWEKDYTRKTTDVKKVKIIVKDDIPFNHPEYEYFSFAQDHNEVTWNNCAVDTLYVKKVYKTVQAKDLFDLVMKSNYNFAEPGFILIDKVNKENNLYFCEIIRCTNPCVTGDTRLATQMGLVTVKELYDNQSSLQVTVDNRAFGSNLGVTTRPAVPVFKTAEKANVYEVVTKRGYRIKASEWHEFYTSRGKLPLKELTVGDTLFIQSGKGQFGNSGSRELGAIIGWITGDGHFSNDEKAISAYLSFWNDDRKLAEDILADINNITANVKTKNNRKYSSKIVTVDSRNMSRIKSRLLARYLDENFKFNGVNKLRVPEVIWQGTEECIKGYISALFQADGTVNYRKNGFDIRLASSYPDLLSSIQILLSNFGIACSIYKRRDSQLKMMPNGKGGHSEYLCKAPYELIICGESKKIFCEEIGFLGSKQGKLQGYITVSEFPVKEKYEAIIKSIEFCGTEDVYDTTQNDKNAVIFQGLHVGQCAEQPLHPLTSCLLGSMILPKYVKNEFESNVYFDFDSLYNDVLIANRALDNVVEINNLPLEMMRTEILNKRRHGLGITGLGSSLNMLNMKYGDDNSLNFAGKIAHILAKASLEANLQLAEEKGCCPVFNTKHAREAVIKSEYMQRLLESLDNKDEIIKKILKHGLRFSHATSIAPTGTMSLTWGNNCSNGIEPVFSNNSMRNIRTPGKKTKVQEEVFDYAYFMWEKKNGKKALPDSWSTTENITVSNHIDMQAKMQVWCDSSISKTINIPVNYSFEEFKNVYIECWKKGLKGVSTFRFNPESFSGVMVQKENLEKTEYTFILDNGEEITVKGSDTVEYDGEEHNASNLFDALKEGIYGKM